MSEPARRSENESPIHRSMEFTRRRLLLSLLAAPLAAALAAAHGQESGAAGPLSKAQEDRLKKFLPRTFARLQRRDPVFIAVCGDEISDFREPGAEATRSSHLMSWYGRFLNRLGGPFSYHGGVVDLNPPPALAGAELKKQWDEYRKLRAAWEKTKKGAAPPIPGVPEAEANGPDREFDVNDLVRLSQPAEDMVPNSTAFYARNYSIEGAVAVQVFDPLLSLVFHTDEKSAPDIVIIAYGTRDALAGVSLATFRTVLEAAVAEARRRGADVILAGPPPALDEASERAAVGRSRPWAAVMREVAEAAGVFFADLGAAAVHQPSDLLNRTVEDSFRVSLEPVRRMFDHGRKVHDGLHPNAAAHLRMGERTADWLLNGEPVRPFEVSGELDTTAGPDGEAILTIRVASNSKDALTVALCPLRFTGWEVKPGSPDKVHTFKPDRGARLFRYAMVRGTAPLPGDEEFIRGSVLISDDDAQHLADVKVKVLPLVLLWPEERADRAGGDHLLKCTLVNTGRDELTVALTLDWLGKQSPLPGVTVGAGQRVPLPVSLPLPPPESTFRFKDTVVLRAAAAGRTWQFTRGIEGVRHAGLGKKMPLVPLSRWRGKATAEDAAAAGAQLTVAAVAKGVFFQIEVPADASSAVAEGKPWGRLEVQLDGRKAGENGTLGCVGSIVIELPRQDGPGRILPVRPAVFGNGYAYPYDAKGFRAQVRTAPDGSRRIEFNMARIFLQHHEWSLDGAGQSDLGINVRLFLCDSSTGGFSDTTASVLTASAFPPADARSLTLLELRGNPAARWSLRIG